MDAIKAIRNGNKAAFDIIYNRYYGIIFTIAFDLLKVYKRSDAGQEAEDVVQEVFISLWIRRVKLPVRSEIEMKQYVARMSKNITIDHIRKNTTRLRYDTKFFIEDYGDGLVTIDGNSEQEYNWQYPVMVKVIKKIMKDKTIPKDTREAIDLFYGEGISAADIAKYNNQHLQTIKNKIHRTLKIIQQRAVDQLGQFKHGDMHVS